MGNMLGAQRLSHDTDGSTSIERQGEQLTAAAQMRGDTLVALTEDVDVSGAVSPFERDDLGPWLTDPEKIAQWDVLAFTKIDRISRSLLDFVTLLRWAEAHGKTLLSVTEGVDFGTPVGSLIGQILAMFAEFERTRMAERRREHTVKAVRRAHWDGRSVPPGYRPVKVGDHFELEPDESRAAQIQTMASAIIEGSSARQVAIAHGMTTSGVLDKLRNPSLRGYVVHHGEIVRGDDGMPVQRTAILDDETWNALQTALDRAGKPGSGRSGGQAAMLLGVARCWQCGAPLYIYRRPSGNRYRHADGSECTASYLARVLEGAVESALLTVAGNVRMIERVEIKGENHDAEVKRVEESMAQLDAAFEAGDVPASAYGRMQARLEAKAAHLRSLPRTDDTTRDVPLDKTYAQHWAELDTAGRQKFLADNGVKLRVGPRDAFLEDWSGSVMALGRAAVSVDLGDLYELCEAARVA